MYNTRFAAILLVLFAVCTSVFGQMASVAPQPVRLGAEPALFPLAEIKEGLRGTAKTVFHGTVPEEFTVEILGVMPNWIGPKQDMIVGRLSGANAERTFVFAGMSGSPVYIGGRLVGAISYSFPFAKEPICGITPIEQMISTVVTTTAAKPITKSPQVFSYAELLANTWKPAYSNDLVPQSQLASGFSSDSRLMAVAGQTFRPIATPVAISGLSQQTIDMFAADFARAGILPVAASGGGSAMPPMKQADETTLRGGDSVVVHLSTGDIQIAAAGTVTLRDGDKIYAFGHPFFSLGSTNLPMSESHVVTVVPNANNSFKLAVPDSPVGSMTQDRATGIYGSLGEQPRMIPVKINMTTSRGQKTEMNFASAVDETLTPLIVNAGVANAISAQERGLGETTIELNAEIKVHGQNPIVLKRRFGGQQASAFAAAAPTVALASLMRAGFAGADVTGIKVDMTSVDGSKTGVLDRISIDRNQVRAGETIEVSTFSRAESGNILVQMVPVTIPKDTAPGALSIVVGDGNAIQQTAASLQFVPKTAAELINTINHLKRSDRLYAILSRTSAGAIIGSSELPNLPPSVLATLNNDRTAGGSKPAIQTVLVETELQPGEYIITGSQTLSVEVVR